MDVISQGVGGWGVSPWTVGQLVVNGVVLGAIYGLIAIGYTMVYGILGMINFAHGEIYMISAYLAAIFLAAAAFFGLNSGVVALVVALVFTVGVAALYGYTLERVAYRPIKGGERLAPLISAIGMSIVLQNYVQLAQGARDKAVPQLFTQTFEWGQGQDTLRISAIQALIVVVTLVAMWGLTYFVNQTPLGRATRATEQDRTMAQLLGINTQRVISTVFMLGSGMAGVAGVLITLNFGAFNFVIGFVAGVKAFTAAVLGGIGSLPGAMLGGLILGLSESLFAGLVNTDYKDVFTFGLLILVLVFRPTGLLGRPPVEKV